MAEQVVFVVGADSGRRRLLARELTRRLAVPVVSMGSGESTVAWARAARPAVLLTDLHMPGLDGYSLARRLKSHPDTRAIQVVLVSGEGPDGYERARAAGCTAYVSATATPAELGQVVQDCLRMRPAVGADAAA